MMPKATALVNGSQTRSRSFAIQAQKAPAKTDRSLCCPSKQQGRKLSARKRAAHGQAVNKSGLVRGRIGPEKSVLELELDCAGCFVAAPGQEKMTFGHVKRDPLR